MKNQHPALEMHQTPKSSFKSKLLLGSITVMTLIAVLLLIGNGAIQRAVKQQEEVRNQTVLPLAEMSNLQAQIYRIRVTEANLSQINDYFAMAAEVDFLNRQITEFHLSLDIFLEKNRELYDDRAELLESNWLLMTNSLEQVIQAANEMNSSEVDRLSAYDVQPRFNTLITLMEQLAVQINKGSEEQFQEAILSLEKQRTQFLIFSLAAMLILVGLMLNFTRYLSGRVSFLHAAFTRVSSGYIHDPIDVRGSDELAELAVAFNAMQDKIASREKALLKAREELELRVEQRTNQLQEINFQLQQEIDVRLRAEENLRVLSQAVSQSPISIIIAGVDGGVEYVNQAFTDCSGFSVEEIKGNDFTFLNNLDSQPELSKELWDAINNGQEWRGELANLRKNGQRYWEYTHISPVTDETGQITHYLIIKNDITERKEQEQKIIHQAHFDSLTELPNRSLAMDRLAQGVIKASRNNDVLALMFIDLDGFKNVNDSLGHDIGDQLLIHASKRLSDSVRNTDTVARLGGDEFLIIMEGLVSRRDCLPVLNKIKESFGAPFNIGSNELKVTPSIGLSLFPDDGQDGDVLLRNADLAMYQAKEAGRNTHHFFNQEMHKNLRRRLEIENQLKHALEKGELFLLYQPIVEAKTYELKGLEALIRWDNELLGRVMPDEFISVAEQSGLIIPIGNWLVNEVLAQMKCWHGSVLEDIAISINVSPRQIQDQSLQPLINDALEKYSFTASKLILEVTEGLLIRNPLEAKSNLQRLKDLGVQLAMDDFGTGYSSLSNLKNFPFDILKIDRTFVRDIEKDDDDYALVSAAVSMGRGLGLRIVAEGIETKNQLEILSDMQCDSVQGFYFSRPLSAEAIKDWSEKYHYKPNPQ
ncbi:EAL domain-containing protein [Neptuniibacter caesariensis]|uniref:Regulatory component of sensory transduction system n=1 Tax=Neptuniibacter caesariensis TaxID=207954 RepID=A0A7U8GRV5_NEPCE|nr:EAL domain-containing protein [Neptuniibacter caesariensis]EAR60643.1 regulatory component of sensory transduction system [Oceanospirillum sp. MED92] [Neptuniibacter caesariensis]